MASLTDDSPAPPRKSMRAVFLELFPWLSRFGLSSNGALAIKSAAGRTELEGGGPAVARAGDLCGRFIFDGAAGVLYYSPSATAAYVAVAANLTTPVLPLPAAPGTTIVIATGSGKVTCG